MDSSNCFTLFPALPTELRWKIWDYAMSAHFIVDFVPKLDAGDFPVAAGEIAKLNSQEEPRSPLTIMLTGSTFRGRLST